MYLIFIDNKEKDDEYRVPPNLNKNKYKSNT
jgi:hypothetical protein